MMNVTTLQDSINQLRNAVWGRGARPRAGVSPALAADVDALAESYRRWLDTGGAALASGKFQDFKARYLALRARAASELGAEVPEPVSTSDEVKHHYGDAIDTAGNVALGLGVVLAAILLTRRS